MFDCFLEHVGNNLQRCKTFLTACNSACPTSPGFRDAGVTGQSARGAVVHFDENPDALPLMNDSIAPAAKRPREGDDPGAAPARGESPAPSDVELSGMQIARASRYDVACLPSGSSAWHVPSTAHTGGAWAIVDGFATPEECAALIAASGGLEELNEPSARYRMPPTNADYRSADAAGVQIPAARDLARRAAIFTGVPANDDGDCVMLARTARLAPNDDEPDAARDDDDAASVDSEGFLLAPDVGKSAEAGDATRGDAEAPGAALINVHHDHNRDERRTCTVFVYLSDVGEDGGGETFFPCAKNASDRSANANDEDSAADPVASVLASLGARGVHVAWAAAEDAREAAAVALCAERFESLKRQESECAPPGAPPGVRFCGDGGPGLAVAPRAGRAVIFWNGASAESCPEAWHAPARVRGDAPKWLMTLFKVGERGRDAAERGAAERGAAAAADPADPADRSKAPERARESAPGSSVPESSAPGSSAPKPAPESAPESAPASDPEAEAEAALAALGAAAAASGKGAAAAAAFGTGFHPDRGPDARLNPMLCPPTHVVAKRKSLCFVDGCENSRKTPSSNNRLPLTCPAHAGARAVMHGGVLSRECQACRTFHELGAFDRDNKTCETRLLRKKLRYRARTLGAETDAEDREGAARTAKRQTESSAAAGDAEANESLAGPAGAVSDEGRGGAWAAVAAVTKGEGATGGTAGTSARAAEGEGSGRKRAADGELDARMSSKERALAGAAAAGEAAAKKPGPRRGRPPGSKNKNWTSKIVAASYLEQHRKAALRRRAEDAAAEQALASLPPGLRAAYAANARRLDEPGGGATAGVSTLASLASLPNLATLPENPFGYAAVAAAASEAAAAFAERHGAARARERSESDAGPGPAGLDARKVQTNGADPFASLGELRGASDSFHHAILAARTQAQARAEEQLRGADAAAAGANPWRALGWPGGGFFAETPAPGGAGSNAAAPSAGRLSVAALARLAGREPGAGGPGVEDRSLGAHGGDAGGAASAKLLADARERAATARVNHLMRVASAMDPAVAAALRGAAERAGALGEAGIGGDAAGIAPNQEGGCSIS